LFDSSQNREFHLFFRSGRIATNGILSKIPFQQKKPFIQEAAFLLNEEKEKSGAVDRPDLPLLCSALPGSLIHHASRV